MDRRLFLHHATHLAAGGLVVTAGGLVVPGCDGLGPKDSEPDIEVPLPAVPMPGENRFVGTYAGLVRLPDGSLGTLDLAAYGHLTEKVEVRGRLVTPTSIDGAPRQIALNGSFDLLYGDVFALSEHGISIRGRLPAQGSASGSGSPAFVGAGGLVDPTALGDSRPRLTRTSAPATTDTRIVRLSNVSADFSASPFEGLADVVQTLTNYGTGPRPTSFTAHIFPSAGGIAVTINAPIIATPGQSFRVQQIRSQPGTTEAVASLVVTRFGPDGVSRSFAGVAGELVLDASEGSASNLKTTFYLRGVRVSGFAETRGTASLDFSGTTTAAQRG